MIGINMPMPECCIKCRFLDRDDGLGCLAWSTPDHIDGRYIYYKDIYKRQEWCPLIDLSKKEEPT